MYEVWLERRAERDLRRLPEDVYKRVVKALKALKKNPRPSGVRKIVGSRNDWRVRVGDWRIVYEVDGKTKAVRVFRIRHRREAYR